MLVLSRRAEERIVFPDLGISLHLLRIKGNVVRLGVEAPDTVRVLRDELSPRPPKAAPPGNLLDDLAAAVRLFAEQRDRGRHAEADATLARVLRLLARMERPVQAPAPPRPVRTLVVEDDANQRALLAGLLRVKGCDCDTAADGHDALSYLKSNERPDVVLLDMIMPGLDGPQTLAAIRAEPRLAGLKVFAVSGTSPDE